MTPQDTFVVEGLHDPVEILVDEWGVPHIYAASEMDLFVAQGFNAARDRLFQIDLWRRRGLGRLSEVFGQRFVEHDRAARLFLYRGDMRAEWLSYGSKTKAVTSAFTRGVNAYISWALADPERLPPEFAMFGYEPAMWEPHEIALIRSHGLFANAEQELARALTIRDFGVEVEKLRRVREPEGPLTVPSGLDLTALSSGVLDTYRLALAPVVLNDESTAPIQHSSEPGGSNNWVISGERTTTGRPILANDPHRTVTLPSLRYIAHLDAPGLSVIGGGEPALPGISIGHNGKIAFGLTIFAIDQEDLYVYETNPQNSAEYWYQGRWEPMTRTTEVLKVAGESDVEAELLYTRHGPVVYQDKVSNVAVAVRAAWLEPGMAPYLGSMDYMNSRTCDEFVTAMNRWGAPGENQLYASPDGTIGWQPGGLVPVRPNWDGSMPVPGNGDYEWAGFYDLDVLPNKRNPAEGWIATANENNLPEDFPNDKTTVTYDWYADSRYQRIAEVLASNERVSVQDCVGLQTDYVSLPARQIISLLRLLPLSASTAPEALRLLQEWDANETADSAAAALFEIWYRRHMRPQLWRWHLEQMPDGPSDIDGVLRAILPNEDFTPDPRTDLILLDRLHRAHLEGSSALEAVLDGTLPAAVEELSELLGDDMAEWAWGKLHHSELTHPFYGAMDDPKPEWAKLGPHPRGGSGDTVGVTSYTPDFNQTVGSTFRIVIDVGEWDNSVAMNSPGQSSDPRSPHYSDLYQLWADDESFPLLYSRRAVEAHTSFVIRLTPAAESS